MSEFVGLWKYPNNPAWAKSVGIFRMLKPLDTIPTKEGGGELANWLSVYRIICVASASMQINISTVKGNAVTKT